MKKKPAFWLALATITICVVIILIICISSTFEDKEESTIAQEPVQDQSTEVEEEVSEVTVPILNTYIYEKVGLYSDLVITLYEDGTFTFSEGLISSHFGYGRWLQVDKELTLYDESMDEIHKISFTIGEDQCLYYHLDWIRTSTPFIFIELEEGAKFISAEMITEEQRADLDAQAKKMREDFIEACEEPKEVNSRYTQIQTWDFNAMGTKQILSVDGTQRLTNPQAPVKIWLSSEDGKILWEDQIGCTPESWNSYFIYRTEESDYLLQYYLNDADDKIDYSFSVIFVDNDGTKDVVLQSIATSMEERSVFNETVNPILQQSECIVNTLFGE